LAGTRARQWTRAWGPRPTADLGPAVDPGLAVDPGPTGPRPGGGPAGPGTLARQGPRPGGTINKKPRAPFPTQAVSWYNCIPDSPMSGPRGIPVTLWERLRKLKKPQCVAKETV